jgi:polyisoprenoid-binding protein YceI
MNTYMIIKRFLIALLAMGGMSLALANTGEGDICSPFRDGKVDEATVATMLDAADSGYLYRIRRDTSQVGFCVSSGWTQVKGQFSDFSGGLALVPDDRMHAAEEQAMVMIQTASLETRSDIVEGLIKGESFFDVEHFPEILFVSHGFVWTGDDTAQIIGDLTVRGITRQVIFDVTLTPMEQAGNSAVERMKVKATTRIHRTDFGMDSMPGLVSDTVDLCMSVEAVRYTGN